MCCSRGIGIYNGIIQQRDISKHNEAAPQLAPAYQK
jgi:hypothetical protein